MTKIFVLVTWITSFFFVISAVNAEPRETLQVKAGNLAHIENPTERVQAIRTELKRLSDPKDKVWLMRYTIQLLVQKEKGVLPVQSRSEVQNILKLVNKERQDERLNKLSLNETLNKVAQAHAEYMKDTGDFNHVTKDGISPFDRIENGGYEYRSAGENIAWGQESPEEVMQDWMNSPGHKANILRDGFTEMGVGFSCNNKNRCYWVQIFGSK